MYQELGEQGFTAQEITAAMRERIINKLVEADVRSIGQAKTPRQQRLWLLYESMR